MMFIVSLYYETELYSIHRVSDQNITEKYQIKSYIVEAKRCKTLPFQIRKPTISVRLFPKKKTTDARQLCIIREHAFL